MKKGKIKKLLKDRTEMLYRLMNKRVLCILLGLLQGVSGSSTLINHAKNGNLEQVKAVVSQGEEDINVKDEYGNTALMWAAKKGYTEVVKYLCKQDNIDITIRNGNNEIVLIWVACMKGDQVNLVRLLRKKNKTSQYINWNYSMDKCTPLICAAMKGNIKIVEYLCQQKGIDLNLQDNKGNTALIRAAMNNHTDIVEHLCQQKGINVSLKNNNNETALIWVACMQGDQVNLVKLLRKKNKTSQYINWQNSNGYNALICAAMKRNKNIVEYLCQQDSINLNLQNTNGHTALTIASNNKDIKNYLLKHEKIDKNITLIAAARTGQVELVKLLVNDYSFNEKNNEGNTALIWVAYMKGDQLEFVKKLCEKDSEGKYINLQDTKTGYTALICAAMNGNTKTVEYLCQQKGIDLNLQDKGNNTALIWAAKNGHKDIVEHLCQQKDINVSLKNNNNETALMWVAYIKGTHVDLVKLLYEKNKIPKYINWQNNNDYTALMCAAINGDIAIVKYLCEQDGIKLNLQNTGGYTALTLASNEEIKNYLLNHEKINKNITFISAARTGQLELVKLLLEKYASDTDFDINAKDKQGNTAFIWAVRNGYTVIVEHLCAQKGIKLNLQNTNNDTALICAARNGYTVIVEHLCAQKGIKLNLQNTNNDTALICAARNGYTVIVEHLCAQKGIKLNLQNSEKNTALICAVQNFRTDTVKHLCAQEGIKLNLQNKNDDTALICAARSWRKEIIEHLCKQEGINVSLKNKYNETALNWVASMPGDQINLVKLLCQKDNSSDYINWQAKSGLNPLISAALKKNTKIVKYLCLQDGINLNLQDNRKMSALIWVAMRGYIDIIDYLRTQKGINPNLQDNKGNTAFSWAAYGGHEKCIDSLLKYTDIDPKLVNNDGDTPIHRAVLGTKKQLFKEANDYKPTCKKLIDAGIDTQQENNSGKKAIDLLEDNELKTILREYVPKKPDSTDIDNNDSTDNSDKTDSDNINADRTSEVGSYIGTIVFIALLLTTGSLIAATLFFWPKNDTKSKKDTVYDVKYNSKNKDKKRKKRSRSRAIQVA